MNVATFTDVTKTFKGVPLLSGVSFDLQKGNTYGLVGPNGSGKSVLFKMLCGFVKPDSGQISIAPEYLAPNRSFPEKFGITIDGPAYLPLATGFENLWKLASIRKVIDRQAVADTMDAVGLSAGNMLPVRKYSLGMKQKLSLAQALMEKPEVLVLDEPFNALDHDSVVTVRNILRTEQDQGTTILFTSHNREDIDDLAQEILEISDGRVTERRRTLDT